MKMLNSIFSSTAPVIGTQDFIICIVVAIVLGVIVSLTHKATSKTSPNFALTLMLLPVLVEMVILLVNGETGVAVAVAGAFSLVRFRSIAGNSKEIVSVFWAMAVGLAVGVGCIGIAVTITVVGAIVMFVASKLLEVSSTSFQRKLKIDIPENLDYESVFKDLLAKYTVKHELMKVKTTNMGSMYELQYIVTLRKNIKEKAFMDEIRIRNGNMLVMLERPMINEEEL